MARPNTKKKASKSINSRKRRFYLPYPLILFLLLCSGVYLLAATLKSGADNIFVTAAVHGPPVTSPAVITSPAGGSHFTAIPIKVSGSCPANAAYVEIFRNNLMSGSAKCQIDGSFGLSVDLFAGRNDLSAHVFNVTDDEGPVSAVVTVYYDVPQPVNRTPANSPAANKVPPLVLTTAFLFKGYYVGQAVQWPLQITGGSAPYAINVDWGDGNNDVISRGSAGDFTISHTYLQPGPDRGAYTIKIKASDSLSDTAFVQFFVIVNQRNNLPAAGNIYNKPTPHLGASSWLWIVWPAYLILLLLVLSFWLGEREELLILRRQHQLKR